MHNCLWLHFIWLNRSVSWLVNLFLLQLALLWNDELKFTFGFTFWIGHISCHLPPHPIRNSTIRYGFVRLNLFLCYRNHKCAWKSTFAEQSAVLLYIVNAKNMEYFECIIQSIRLITESIRTNSFFFFLEALKLVPMRIRYRNTKREYHYRCVRLCTK